MSTPLASTPILQTTLKKAAYCAGIGLHSGKDVRLILRPAPSGTGIVFRRKDVDAKIARIPARYDLVTATRLGTTLTNAHGVSVATIEHLMAALWGAGIDNAIVDLDGPEVPIMDGSAAPFSALIAKVGARRLSAPRKILRILREVEIRQGNSVAILRPYEGEEYSCSLELEIDFGHRLAPYARAAYDFTGVTFEDALASARTFGFAHEVEMLRAQGLARGGSLENAIVIGEDRILNEEGLRFNDEFIRHKALDCLGDVYLAGMRIEGAFSFVRPGHGINNALLRALFDAPDAWEAVTAVTTAPTESISTYAFA